MPNEFWRTQKTENLRRLFRAAGAAQRVTGKKGATERVPLFDGSVAPTGGILPMQYSQAS